MNGLNNVIALISARGGSKGLPGKNIRLLGGKPLITWSIEAALGAASVARVLVSTDDPGIAEVARAAGAEVPFLRPAELARDDSPHILTSEHAIGWLKQHQNTVPDYVLLLQPTSPFRNSADINAAIELAHAYDAIAVASVSDAKPHPQKTYKITRNGTLKPFVSCNITYRRRQDLRPAFAENGAIYLNRTKSLLRYRTYIPAGTLPYVMPPERSLDIDSAWDFQMAEMLLRHCPPVVAESVKLL